jgi:hypothetical protein
MRKDIVVKKIITEELCLGEMSDEAWGNLLGQVLETAEMEINVWGDRVVLWTDWTDDKFSVPLIKLIEDAVKFNSDTIGALNVAREDRDMSIKALQKTLKVLESAIPKLKNAINKLKGDE